MVCNILYYFYGYLCSPGWYYVCNNVTITVYTFDMFTILYLVLQGSTATWMSTTHTVYNGLSFMVNMLHVFNRKSGYTSSAGGTRLQTTLQNIGKSNYKMQRCIPFAQHNTCGVHALRHVLFVIFTRSTYYFNMNFNTVR